MRRPEGFDGPPRTRREPDPATAAESATSGDAAPALEGSDEVIVTRARGRRRSESHASRTDRLLREAELRQLRLDRIDARRARARAKRVGRDRRRVERAQVRRFTAASRRRVRTSLIAVGALVGAFAVLVGLVHSPLMTVREIEVQGTQRLESTTLQAALAGNLGQPIATVTDAGVREDLERFTGLESFVVDVVPPGTIVVRVVERQPVVVAEVEGQDEMVDPAGVGLGAPDGTPLPRLEGVEIGSDAFAAVAASIVAMPAALREQVSSIGATTSDDVAMTLASGQQVVWGGAEDSRRKAVVLAALVAAADPAAAETFDVSAPDHPVVRT